VGDNADAFPNDATEVADTDLDGIGNNADPDDDNDGVADADDGDPLNADIGIQPSQLISVAGNPVGVNGHSTRISLSYDTSDGNNQLPGIGFRLHYNSETLSFAGTENSIANDIIVDGDGPYQDDSDFDNDSNTDKYIIFGWAALYGDWPNKCLPTSLVDVVFNVSWEAFDQASITTPINFSKVSTTEGYNFDATNYSLNVLPSTWDFDGNGQADALTDGLILLRHAFGLRGASLTENVMAADSTMTSDEVQVAVENALVIADVDGDGNVDALTDGLIVLRYMFGLTGEYLIDSVVSANATRASGESIGQYIELFMPVENYPDLPINVSHLNFQSSDEIILEKCGQVLSVMFSQEKNAHVKVTNQTSIPIVIENTLTAGSYGGSGYAPSAINADIATLENGNFYVGYVIEGGNSWGTSYVNAYYQQFSHDGQTIGPTIQFLSAKGWTTSIYFEGDVFDQLNLSVNWQPDSGRPFSTETVSFSTAE
jgi:hypothetical protein